MTAKENNDVKLNLFEKINQVKKNILDGKIKKSGKNKFSGFDYYELADFVPTIINSCNELKLFTKFNYFQDKMTLEIIDCEAPQDKIEYQTTTKELQLKGCNEIQALGGTQTYLRRYLFLMAFDIVEPDNFDANVGNGDYNDDKTITDFEVLYSRLEKAVSMKQIAYLSNNHKVELTDAQKNQLNNLLAKKKEELSK